MSDDQGESLTPQSDDVGQWLSLIDEAKKDMRDYSRQCERIRKKYRYENSLSAKRRKFQMLWANQEILRPAVYAKRPSPAVSNRWKDGDVVAKKASELLERVLDFQFDTMDYDHAFKQCRDDYLLFARGVVRLRYEPVFRTDEVDDEDDGFSAAKPEGNKEVADQGMVGDDNSVAGHSYGDATGSGQGTGNETDGVEELALETVALDFVHLTDFVHPKARSWHELPWIDFISYMSRKALIKRFPKCGAEVQLDTIDEGEDREKKASKGINARKAVVHEIWDKEEKRVIWLSPGYPDILDSCDPYLKFEGFFPCPRPAYGTLSTDSLEPRPDYVFYQDQAEEIDELTSRIGALTESLKLVGFYPAGPSGEGAPEIEMAVRPGFENRMIAVKSWGAFTKGGGNTGAPIVWLPVEQVGEILKGCVEMRKQLIDDVYQLTGISDIIRGTTEAEETAAAQGLKSQWGSLRLKERQNELARLGRDVTRMAAEVVANHFQVSTMAKCANMKIPAEAEQYQQIQQYQVQLRQFVIAQQQKQVAAAHQGQPQLSPPGASPPGAAPGDAPSPQASGPPQGQGSGPPSPAPTPNAGQMPPAQPGPASGPPAAAGGAAPQPPQPPQIVPTQEQIEQLLRDGVTRRFLIDIETDSMIATDEDAERQQWAQFLEAVSKFIVAWVPLIEGQPILLPVAAQLLLSAVRRYRVGRECEEVLEQAFDKLQAAAGQAKPPSGEQLKAQADLEKAKAEIQKAQIDAQSSMQKAKADVAMVELKGKQAKEQHDLKMQQMQMEMHLETQKLQMGMQAEKAKLGMQHQLEATKMQHATKLADQQAQISSAQLGGQHVLETQKTQNAQKTLSQQAQADETKLAASQAMDQFKTKNAIDVNDAKAKSAMALAETKTPDAGPEAKPAGGKRKFKIGRDQSGRMSEISEA
jgi:hypothetical protein